MYMSDSTGSLTARLSLVYSKVLVFLSSTLKTNFVLGVPLGSPKTRDVPTRSQIVCVRERASLGVLFYRTLIRS